jgi:hypothetical protein
VNTLPGRGILAKARSFVLQKNIMARRHAASEARVALMILSVALLSKQAAAAMHSNSAAAAPGGKTAFTIQAQLLDVCAAAKPTLILISGELVLAALPVHAGCQQHRCVGACPGGSLFVAAGLMTAAKPAAFQHQGPA